MLTFQNVSFQYPNYQALEDVSFTLNRGQVYALIGKNGAGKTTLLRCAAGLEHIDSGVVTIDGIRVHDNPQPAQAKLGYARDLFGLYEEMTGQQFIRYIAETRKVPADVYKHQYRFIDQYLELSAFDERVIKGLTRGMRQKLAIAQTLIHQPDILLLDEPASGLDPNARQQLSRLLQKLKQQGLCILVTSHILGELEEYATDVLVLNQAKVETLHKADESYIAVIKFLEDKVPENLLPELTIKNQIAYAELPTQAACSQLLKTLIENNINVLSFQIKPAGLEKVFKDS